MNKENIIEIFSSIQGEGKYVGCRQIFIRLADCNLKCKYCDTNFKPPQYCEVKTADNLLYNTIDNPVSVESVVKAVKHIMSSEPIHSISFTGGEPLMHADFIKALSSEINVKIFLETNGTLYDELKRIIDCIDIISMDIKLPSATNVDLFDKHYQFMQTAKTKDLYTKIVISGETLRDEFVSAVNTIAKVSKDILLILQPVTPTNGVKAVSIKDMLHFQELALKYLRDVRIIPQTHKMLNVI